VQSGDNCSLIVLNSTITIGHFENINPSVDSDCTNLIAGLAYCVFPAANWNDNSSSGDNTTSTYVTAPAPTPTGTTGNCYQYHTIITGDYCSLLENQYEEVRGLTSKLLVRQAASAEPSRGSDQYRASHRNCKEGPELLSLWLSPGYRKDPRLVLLYFRRED
jgi:hypothetical protein